jgi:hypothetical protein
VATAEPIWGRFEEPSRIVLDGAGPDRCDLIDRAIADTVLTDGDVFVTEPAAISDRPYVALLRY